MIDNASSLVSNDPYNLANDVCKSTFCDAFKLLNVLAIKRFIPLKLLLSLAGILKANVSKKKLFFPASVSLKFSTILLIEFLPDGYKKSLFKLAIEAIKSFDKPYLIGAHISEGIKLPSGEKISEIITTIDHKNLLGIMLSCVSPENYEKNLDEIRSLGIPFGFKLNGFITTKPTSGYTNTFRKSKTGNPNEFLGHREDLIPEKMALIAKKFKEAGATILGGCCETRPAHIKEMAKLK